MAGVNRVILVGNLGKDPEVRHLESGTSVANFSLATSETYKDRSGERKTITEWHNIAAWRGLADIAEKYLKKGSQVYIEGKLRTRSWDDKDGNTRYTTEVLVDNMTMLGRPPESNSSYNTGGDSQNYNSGGGSSQSSNEEVITPNTSSEDDLPF